MKKKIIILNALIGLLMAMQSACTKDFKELNTNPNTADKVLPETLLARALVQTVNGNMSRSRTISNELMQVTVNTLVETDRIFRYDIRNNVSETPWNNWYLQLSNFKDIYQSAADIKNDSYMAISLICQAWIYSIITDTYGDVPYTQSNRAKEGIYQPAFDQQKDIYPDLFQKLDSANILLKSGKNVAGNSDPVYGGNVSLWRKFGNSLYLRLLLRVSGKADVSDMVITKIKEMVDTHPADYPIISSNAESAILRWTGVTPYISPFRDLKQSEWRYPKICSFFADKLDATSDPCISKWVTLTDGLYAGIPSGYPYGETPEPKSYLPYDLMSEPLLGNILNFAEVQLILAETASKGWISTGTAGDYYETGVTNRITLWGKSLGSYLEGSDVKWDDTLPLEDKMERIQLQKYFALFYTDLQSWFEYRRTGHPILPKGPGLFNDGVMPARLLYPTTVQATNELNYDAAVALQGPDNLKTMVWWQKP